MSSAVASSNARMSLADLFPDLDYRHHLSVKRGDTSRFFAPTDESILRERARWLNEAPENYAGALDGSEPFIEETATLLNVGQSVKPLLDRQLAREKIVALGKAIEPDIVILEKQNDGIFKVVAGCVCFPSSWNFAEKLGYPLDIVHSIVPGLNQSIGAPIARFLEKIQSGTSWERSNWGLSASPERNQHPARNIPRLSSPVSLDHVWLRVEDQILSILPETRALLFGIRIVTRSLDDLRERQPELIPNFRRALESMPEPMARYKNIEGVRREIIDLLG